MFTSVSPFTFMGPFTCMEPFRFRVALLHLYRAFHYLSSCSPVNPMVTMRLKYDVSILVCHVRCLSLPSCSVVNNSIPLVYYWSTSCMDDLCCVFPVSLPYGAYSPPRDPTSAGSELTVAGQGRIYSKQGPVRKKMWGPVTWGGRPYFFLEKLATFFGHRCRFYSFHSGGVAHSPIISGMQKNCRSFCGAPFCGGPCSAEHAEYA